MAALVDGGGGPKADRASPDSGSAGAAWWQGPRARSRSLLSAEYSLLLLLLLGLAVAGWPSFSALLPLAGGDTPVSFVPLVPLMGAVFLLRRFSGAQISRRPRDGFVDGIVLLLLCGAVVVVLLLLPVMMSWDYWLTRLDIPGLVLLLTALVVAAWGLPGLAQLGPALLYLLLAWPLPYLVIYNHIIPPLTDVTAFATRVVASHLPLLGIRTDPQDAYTLLVPFQGQTIPIVVSQSCAGINGALGLAVIGLPIALLGRGSWEARSLWLALGIGLYWLTNVVRIVLILAATAVWGPGMTMAFVHPELGFMLFALSFALLLWLAPLCHLDVASAWRKAPRPPEGAARRRSNEGGDQAATSSSGRRTWRSRKVLLLGAIVIMGGLFDANLKQFRWVSEATLPRVGLARADKLFTLPPRWRLSQVDPIDGWQSLFGPSTVAAVLTVVTPGLPPVDVQAVLTRDAGTFNSYGVEDCYIFHGFVLQAVHTVPLGSGVTATLIDFRDPDGYPAATLYWIQPVQTPQGLYHERLALVANDARAIGRRSRAPFLASTSLNAQTSVQSVATALQGFLAPWVGGHVDPLFARANAELLHLGQAEISWEVRAAGSGA